MIDINILLNNRKIEGDCWLWVGRLNNFGYGVISLPDDNDESKDFLVHRLSYEFYTGPIFNLVLHQRSCPNKNCFNPIHLYDGTYTDNIKDFISTGNHKNQYGSTNKDLCKNGHPLSGDNLLITSEGKRRCKICRTNYNKKNWKKYPGKRIRYKLIK